MSIQNKYTLLIVLILISFKFVNLSHAKDLTSPLKNLPLIITSYFDHSKPGYNGQTPIIDDNIPIYTGETAQKNNGVCGSLPGGIFAYFLKPNNTGNCIWYDGHNGVDFRANVGDDVLSAASGIIQSTTFDNCNGLMTRIWHLGLGYSTLYVHLDTFIKSSGSVNRSELIAKSGKSGSCTTGPHLHFGVRDAQVAGNVMDPYGWSGTTTDPWPHNKGYLWTTDPPSLKPPATYVSGQITKDTTWTATNSPYVVQGQVTVNPGITLTIDPGVIVKFEDRAYMNINGNLNAKGVAKDKIHFTSIKDDSVGGDTNGDGNATSPAPADYLGILIMENATGNIDNAVVQYGGYNSKMICDFLNYKICSAIRNDGYLKITNSLISDNKYAIQGDGGSLIVDSSVIKDNLGDGIDFLSVNHERKENILINKSVFSNNQFYGFHITVFATSSLSVNNTSFNNNGYGDGYIRGPVNFINSGNVTNGLGPNGFRISGSLVTDQIWNSGVPFVLDRSTVSVGPGKTLTIKPGTVIKFEGNRLDIYGNLIATGTPSSKIHFTSIKDDTVGGNTNGTTTPPRPGDYEGIYFYNNANGLFENATLRYAGAFSVPGLSYGVVNNNGGNVSISKSQISDNLLGIDLKGGFLMVDSAILMSNGAYGLHFNSDSSATVSVTNTGFGDHSRADAFFSGNVDFINSGNYVIADKLSRGIYFYNIKFRTDQIWNPGVVFVVGGVGVSSGTKLAIQPGAVIKFHDSYSGMGILGSLSAQATQSNKIYFTSLKDDSVGGDTNGDGNATSPAPGDFRGINFLQGSSGTLDRVIFRYGGYGYSVFNSVIGNGGGNVSISNSQIVNNNNYGIHQRNYPISGTTTIFQSSIRNNADYGINNTSSNSINATNNYWGHESGPYHPTLNPKGKGDKISDNVDFKPWLTYDPSILKFFIAPKVNICPGC